MALQCCLLCSLSLYIYMYIYTQQLFLKKNRCTRFLQEEQHQRIARIKEREKWRTGRSSARLISIQDAHRSIGCRVQPPPSTHYYIHPNCSTDFGGRIRARSRALNPDSSIWSEKTMRRARPLRASSPFKVDEDRRRERERAATARRARRLSW